MIVLEPVRLHWIKDDGLDDPNDLCLHGTINFVVGETSLVSPADESVSVSAAALYLLRTLTSDHPLDAEEPLFPHCGHVFYDIGTEDVLLMGCGLGLNFGIETRNGSVFIARFDGLVKEISSLEWKTAVIEFSTAVLKFYQSAAPKRVCGHDIQGFERFVGELERRHPRGPGIRYTIDRCK